jgi:hypothetical protein
MRASRACAIARSLAASRRAAAPRAASSNDTIATVTATRATRCEHEHEAARATAWKPLRYESFLDTGSGIARAREIAKRARVIQREGLISIARLPDAGIAQLRGSARRFASAPVTARPSSHTVSRPSLRFTNPYHRRAALRARRLPPADRRGEAVQLLAFRGRMEERAHCARRRARSRRGGPARARAGDRSATRRALRTALSFT